MRVIALTILLTGISAMGLSHGGVSVALSGKTGNDGTVRASRSTGKPVWQCSGKPVSRSAGMSSSPFAGKSCEGLFEAVGREARPGRLVTLSDVSFRFYDPFEGVYVDVVRGEFPQEYSVGHFVPSGWWSVKAVCDSLDRDLHNLLPLRGSSLEALATRRPGDVANVSVDYGGWCVGTSEVYGTLTDLYSPPADLRGRLARAYFYVTSVYHSTEMDVTGYMMMSDRWPYLTNYAVELLCRWATDNPPDDYERKYAAYVSETQGGSNPFVTCPDLHEYIWGDKRGETYAEAGEPVPLHSTYRLSETIYLYSPEVPSDAVWKIDGVEAGSESFSPASLSVGGHHLSYTSASTGKSGLLMIKIVE